MMAPFVLLMLFAGGGAGDAKLMAAPGTWLGLMGSLVVLCLVLLAGGLAVAVSLGKGQIKDVFSRVGKIFGGNLVRLVYRLGPPAQESQQTQASHARTMPYGVAIFMGVALAAIGVWLWHA